MKKDVALPYKFSDDKFDEWANSGVVEIADTNQTYDCLESFDKLLKRYNLQVILYDTGRSDYWFGIGPID
ncbi:MAG TPA: hypothetical protein VEP90_00545 [Methylomirabilota bacterium]|nr:hypothetical protein [Methylomirabilota bacterium]